MLKSMIDVTFGAGATLSMAVAGVIIWAAANITSKAAIALLIATGIGGLIVASLISIGLVTLANRYGWSKSKLAFW